jgi:hypothetical protein
VDAASWLGIACVSQEFGRPRLSQPTVSEHGAPDALVVVAENRCHENVEQPCLTISDATHGLFNASVTISVGSGASLLFWEDAWSLICMLIVMLV